MEDSHSELQSGSISNSSWFVAVHAGAGYHSPTKKKEYLKAISDACIACSTTITKGGNCLDGVIAAISTLEDNPLTNSGTGANLTYDGRVECDASIMQGRKGSEGPHGAFGAIGAVRGIKNPIQLAAKLLCEEKKGRMSGGRIRPIFLVGEGARDYAIEHGLNIVSEEQMMTPDSRSTWREHRQIVSGGYKRSRDSDETLDRIDMYDTVGAICMDTYGHLASGVSSGGISLKHHGRIGEAAMFGCGCWAEDSKLNAYGAACSTTGTGEQIIKALLAKECASALISCEDTDNALQHVMEHTFLESGLSEKRYGGIIALKKEPQSPNIEFVWSHTTESMALGYFTSNDTAPEAFISRMESSKSGTQITFGGSYHRFI